MLRAFLTVDREESNNAVDENALAYVFYATEPPSARVKLREARIRLESAGDNTIDEKRASKLKGLGGGSKV